MQGISRNNDRQPSDDRDAEECQRDMQAWVKANPTATPQEIAQHQSDLMEQSVGGLSMVGKELREDRKNYMAAHSARRRRR